ncbi:Group 3 hemoglobin ctb [Candidatus Hepatincola sp. Pdp]
MNQGYINQKYNHFTNENLYDMSARFVDKLLNSEHKELSTIFKRVITNKEAHIKKVASLWQNIYIKKIKDKRESERHAHHTNISIGLMNAWLEEFQASANEVFDEEHTNIIVTRAKKIAEDTHMLKE